MKFCVLMGSPRKNGNTAKILEPFMSVLRDNKCEVKYIYLPEKHILPCAGCHVCQDKEGEYGCVQADDTQGIMDGIIESDFVIFATPIYSWYCTAPMKALLDRHYGLNKFYGKAKGSLWKGKKTAIITTHGYKREYGADLFEEGIKRLCSHSSLNYMGMYSVRDKGDPSAFETEEAAMGAKKFALSLLSADAPMILNGI